MSITILSNPSTYTPANNPVLFLVSSTNVTAHNFKFICDIYEGTGTTRLARLKLFPRPADGYALFDIQRILCSYVSYDLAVPTSIQIEKCPNSIYSYVVKFGEEYGDTITLYPNLTSFAKSYVWNAAFSTIDFPGYTTTPYLVNNSFLTSQTTFKIALSQSACLYWLTNTAALPVKIRISQYTIAGAVISDDDYAISFDSLPDDASQLGRIACGTYQLDGSSTMHTNTAYYTVQGRNNYSLGNTGGDPVGQLYTFIIDNCSPVYGFTRFHFLNKLGGFDSFNFKLAKNSFLDITRQNYKQSPSPLGYTPQQRGVAVYDSKYQERFDVYSDWLSEAETAWLQELLTSPEIYVELNIPGRGLALVAVSISNPSYQIATGDSTPLYNIQLNYQYAHTNNRQRL